MQAMLLSLLTSLATNPTIQKLVMAEVAKIPGIGGIASEIIAMFMSNTAPNQTTKTVTVGPSQTVKNLQTALNVAGANPPLNVDGYMGPKTETALKAQAAKLGVTL